MSINAPIPLIGYCDRLSGRPGDTIEFKISSQLPDDYSARLVRVISADPNLDGPGMIEEECDFGFGGTFPSRRQQFYPGSYAAVLSGMPEGLENGSFTFSAMIWPTAPEAGRQAVLACGSLQLGLDKYGCAVARIGDMVVSTGEKLQNRQWAKVWLSYDADKMLLTVGQERKDGTNRQTASAESAAAPVFNEEGFTIAARPVAKRMGEFFNGKIEAPAVYTAPSIDESALIARWDFAQDTMSTRIVDTGPYGLHGELVNLPARAMTGSSWDGSEMCWRHAPEQYGAIHFHDDDIYDFGWETDFSFIIPEDMPSGIYAVRIKCGENYDAIPFFVCPARGKRGADACVLVSTFTYSVYGNHARPDFEPWWKDEFEAWNAYPHNPAEHTDYGLSTYNYHSDGSGICHASHRRPLLNMRPGYVTFGYGPGSRHRHFQADSHLTSWLNAKDYRFDIITDQELHDEGASALEGYKVLITGSHPEYHTTETLDAIEQFRDGGGNFMYIGGNGFYWRVALHQSEHGAIEIRRAESGIRAWAAEPGEYYNAFDGAYGGLWRRNGRPPQKLAGVGFSAQGQFEGSYYLRNKKADPSTNWVFDGIEEYKLGDFGLSGGGAAGFELDRADVRLGTPENVHILASSAGHGDTFVLVPEEQLTHITNWPGEPVEHLLRADMVLFDVPGGGQVFSTGSITFCGSLPHNNFDNNISTLLGNVLNRFLD